MSHSALISEDSLFEFKKRRSRDLSKAENSCGDGSEKARGKREIGFSTENF
jgi:hypothetical protein